MVKSFAAINKRGQMWRNTMKPYCRHSAAIDELMVGLHGTTALSSVAQYRLALRLQKIAERDIPLDQIFAERTRGTVISRTIDRRIRGSVSRIAAFQRDIDAGRDNEKAALQAIADAGDRWSACINAKHREDERLWTSGESGNHAPEYPLEGHVLRDQEMYDGYFSSYGFLFVRQWFEQAKFIEEILKDPNLAKSALDGMKFSSVEAKNLGKTIPNLFNRTYPSLSFGDRGSDGSFDRAPGYTFTIEVWRRLKGSTVTGETVRSHRGNQAKQNDPPLW